MSEPLHLRERDARRVPWKNGEGFTSELALWPREASFERGDFEWRISKAVVEQAGPFSIFPGMERVLVVTQGAGLWLEHGGNAVRARVEPFVPYRFSGDDPTTAELVDGRVSDFNVLCRRDRARAEVEVLAADGQHELLAAQEAHVFLHVLHGRLELRAGTRSLELLANESFWLRANSEERWTARGPGRALLVRVEPAPTATR